MFAGTEILENIVVWKCDKRTTISWSQEEWQQLREELSDTAFENIERFSYMNADRWLLNLDDSRFMNHSNTPNLGYEKETDSCYALRKIEKGEELTVKYSEFCTPNDDDTCKTCGLCK